ncbi:MAG: aminotransferase class I/II-fold pyridoxal phosphate-dependent enzyme [Fusobacteriaceae bacterium]|jgi:aspartate aminotransferase/aromatic-amino-acid transaminase|nr:aminotransferase class I/II-fold pyridoxal phosphate-dependent enzyme [Fusobacteriaceae bacterium]
MLSKDAMNKKIIDRVFELSIRAKESVEKYGQEKVINATIGSLYGEDNKLVVYDVVTETYYAQEPADFAAYAASLTGSDEFKESVKVSTFGENYKEDFKGHYLEVIATPGGTGALSNTIKNYLNNGETVLIPEWLWEPYKSIISDNQKTFDSYKVFDENGNFNLNDVEKKLNEVAAKQETIMILINDPCQNPTGYKLTREEWEKLFEIFEEIAKTKEIVLINDIAYIDYDPGINKEEYMEIFKNRPKNILTVFTFSISKSLTSYGLRVGAQIALTRDETIARDFNEVCSFSCRSTWSNVSKGGMKMYSDIVLNKEKYKRLKEEREKYVNLLKERADIFLKEAKEIGLEILPYKSGFFLSIPTYELTEKVGYILADENIFTVIAEKWVRIALCSVPKAKVWGLAGKVKEAVDRAKEIGTKELERDGGNVECEGCC